LHATLRTLQKMSEEYVDEQMSQVEDANVEMTGMADWVYPEPKRRLWHTECGPNQHYQTGRVYKRTSAPRPKLKIGCPRDVVFNLIDENWPFGAGVFMFTVSDIMDLWDEEEWQRQIPNNKDIRNTVVKACMRFQKDGQLIILAKKYVVDDAPKEKSVLQIERDLANAKQRILELEEREKKRAKKDESQFITISLQPAYKKPKAPRQSRIAQEDAPIWTAKLKEIKDSLK